MLHIESNDLEKLWTILQSGDIGPEAKTAVWFRIEGILWYNAYASRGLLLTSLDREMYEFVYHLICTNQTRKMLPL